MNGVTSSNSDILCDFVSIALKPFINICVVTLLSYTR